MPLLELHDISKTFGAIEALAGVSLSVEAGEVVALLGDNVPGKSTLVKIISGEIVPSRGRIALDDEERHFASPAEAKAAGIETVCQDLSLCTNLDVVANFFMGRELTRRVLGIPITRRAGSGRRSSSTASSIGAAGRSRRSGWSRRGAGSRPSTGCASAASA